MEIKQIRTYPNYTITKEGIVYSKKYDKALKWCISPKGYPMVRLYNEAGSKMFFVHCLVAEHYVEGKTTEKCFVNHKDENKSNPSWTNLEWCTDSYNKLYSAPTNSLSKQVQQIETGVVIATYFSAQEAARQTGFTQSMISRACRKGCQAYGYQWRYTI